MQRNTEVIHKEVNTSTEGFGEAKHSESIPEREPRSALGDIDYTSKDGCLHTKLTPE